MSFEFDVTQKRFFTDYRNGSTFVDNPTQFTEILQCNVGDRNKLSEIIHVTTIINPTASIEFINTDWITSQIKLVSSGFNFKENGLFVGAVVDVCVGSIIVQSTVDAITGPGNSIIILDETNLGFLTLGPYTNIIIKVKTRPQFLEYRYGIIDSTLETNSYDSQFDDNVQSYYIFLIGGSYSAMGRIGSDVSWDQTETLLVKFNGTTDLYTHEFEIEHTFSIKYFIESELTAILTNVKPSYLAGVSSVKYCNGFFFGGVGSSLSLIFEDDGSDGKVGWFNEALNGLENQFSISDLTITNSSSTGSIEATLVNSVEFTINATAAILTAGSKVIVAHSRLTESDEYANSPDTNAEVFVRDILSQVAGAGAVASSIISNYVVTFVSATELTINYDLTFSAAQQELIFTDDRFILWASVGDEALTALNELPVNLLHTGIYSSDTDTAGLITNHTPLYFDSFSAYAGVRKFTDVAGWDGDMIGYKESFRLTQFLGGEFTQIVAMRSVLVVINSSTGEEFELINKPVPATPFEAISSGGYKYQAFNITTKFTTKIPVDTPINIVLVQSNPPFPAGHQVIEVQLAFDRIPWRDWIENLDVSSAFYDEGELNNGLNEKTSNYNIPPWETYHQLEVDVQKFTPSDTTFEGTVASPTTTYKLRSEHFDIQALGVDPGGIWTGLLQALDILGEVTADIDSNFNMILRGTLNHSLGILPIGDLWAMIWIVKDGTSETPWQLHSDYDWTKFGNPLAASDELLTGNTQFVEIKSELDKVTIYCRTEKNNLVEGITYRVYGRLGKKT